MHGIDPGLSTAANYRGWAQDAAGRSPQYEELARQVADDPGLLGFLATLPPAKRQPNLLFAAACYLLGSPPVLATLRSLVTAGIAALTALMLARQTQTNEPARCATFLPVLARLPQPLALIEVGASAGLTLLPDRYSYDYAGHQVTGRDPQAPVLRCEPRGPVPVPLPDTVPDVRWRAGLDLNPLDVRDGADMRWLTCLLWPGESDRAGRLAAAIETARRDPAPVYRGDLRTGLPALVAQAPPGLTVVVYHSAVLGYLEPGDRQAFATTVWGLPVVWLSNEGRGAVPGVPPPPRPAGPSFVLARDGRTALAVADGHGEWLHWLGPAARPPGA